MLFVNVIKMSFTDLFKNTYQKDLWYNDDSSGFVYASEKEKHELVFYPVLKENDNIEQVASNLVENLWKKNLIWNILPFPVSVILMTLIVYLLLPYGLHFSAAAGIATFLFTLYLSKISLSIIGAAISYRIFLNDKFQVLPLYTGLGANSNIDDKTRARSMSSVKTSPLSNNSEILANSHFVEVRMYQEKNIVEDRNDSRGPVSIDLKAS